MNWKWHIVLGLFIQIAFIVVTWKTLGWASKEWQFYVLIILILFLSPLIPDIDYVQAKISQVIMWVGTVVGLLGIVGYYFFHLPVIYLVIGFLIIVGVFIIATVCAHRGFTHSLIFILLLGGAMFYYTKSVDLSLLGILGMWSHLLGDGIPLKVI